MPSSCAQCGAEFFPPDTGWTAYADCLRGKKRTTVQATAAR
jgi:hypothetical protein